MELPFGDAMQQLQSATLEEARLLLNATERALPYAAEPSTFRWRSSERESLAYHFDIGFTGGPARFDRSHYALRAQTMGTSTNRHSNTDGSTDSSPRPTTSARVRARSSPAGLEDVQTPLLGLL